MNSDVGNQTFRKVLQGNKRIYSDDSNDTSWIDSITNLKDTAEEQLPLFITQIEADPIYYKYVTDICRNLNHTVKYFYKEKNVDIKVFGSAATKLALKNSDCDIFLDFGGEIIEDLNVFARDLKNKIRKNRYFLRPVAISARVPIVKCVHSSGVTCDVSFLNGLGVSNSTLIRFLVRLDERIRPVILILKFLFNKVGLTGQNAITSYALIVLILFFLQQLENPMIPSICSMQEAAIAKKIVANWDTSYTTSPNFFPVTNNTLNVPSLLKKFFEFYASFEFGFYVISVFTAKTYLKPFFSNPKLLPSVFHCYKENLDKNLTSPFECNKFMCVQGPFNHSHNITRGVTEKTLQQFQDFCFEKMKICPEEFESNKSTNYKSQYFKNLLIENTNSPKKMKVTQDVVTIYVGNSLISPNSECTEDELRNHWSENVLDSVINILTKVMKCKVNINTSENYNANTSNNSNEKILKALECELCYFGLVTKKGRNEVKHEMNFPQTMSSIDQEEAISNHLCETILKDSKKVSLKFVIKCTIKKGPTCFLMHLGSKKEDSVDQQVKQIFLFIQTNFPKWIK